MKNKCCVVLQLKILVSVCRRNDLREAFLSILPYRASNKTLQEVLAWVCQEEDVLLSPLHASLVYSFIFLKKKISKEILNLIDLRKNVKERNIKLNLIDQ